MARVSAEQWRERVEAWVASGKTAEAFAASRGIDARQLAWWKWRLARDGRAPRTPGPAFVAAQVAGEPASKVRAGVDVTFASGVVVHVPAGFSPRAVAELIEAVGAVAC